MFPALDSCLLMCAIGIDRQSLGHGKRLRYANDMQWVLCLAEDKVHIFERSTTSLWKEEIDD
jgi:hypothetical protein